MACVCTSCRDEVKMEDNLIIHSKLTFGIPLLSPSLSSSVKQHSQVSIHRKPTLKVTYKKLDCRKLKRHFFKLSPPLPPFIPLPAFVSPFLFLFLWQRGGLVITPMFWKPEKDALNDMWYVPLHLGPLGWPLVLRHVEEDLCLTSTLSSHHSIPSNKQKPRDFTSRGSQRL